MNRVLEVWRDIGEGSLNLPNLLTLARILLIPVFIILFVNPTPDQSLVEENAAAIGVTYEDNEELEFIDKIEKRDRDRYELEEGSKATDDMI